MIVKKTGQIRDLLQYLRDAMVEYGGSPLLPLYGTRVLYLKPQLIAVYLRILCLKYVFSNRLVDTSFAEGRNTNSNC